MTGQLPHQTREVIGHNAAVSDFMAAWGTGRLHHAWLITGPQGIGKATLAYALARWVMAPDRPAYSLTLPSNHPINKQVAGGSCPTLCVVAPDEDEKSGLLKDIGVDAARTIGPFLRLTAADGAWRVVLVDNADLLSVEAQNAILKLLEEPPARCLILLTAAMAGRLLPTIRSRCRTLKLAPLSEGELKRIASTLQLKLQFDKPWLLRHAAGSIGQLVHLSSLDAGALHGAVDAIVQKLPHINWAEVHQLAEKLARKEQDAQFRLVLELLNEALTTRLQQLPFVPSPLIAAHESWDEIQQKIRLATARHLDRTATLIDVLVTAARALQQTPTYTGPQDAAGRVVDSGANTSAETGQHAG